MMLGLSPLPPEMRTNQLTPAIPSAPYFPDFLNPTYPNAVEGDGVLIAGPSDAPEMWVKSGSIWVRGDVPGSQRMTMEYRPSAKRIIDDQSNVWTPGLPSTVGKMVTTATNVDAGKLALIGLIGFLLLRGAIK
jgi:hypothetical protein